MHLKTALVRQRKSFFSAPIFAAAISYRIPRPVTKVIRYSRGDVYPICPKCASSLDREYIAFCDRCGQRLSWHSLPRAEVIFPQNYRELLKTPFGRNAGSFAPTYASENLEIHKVFLGNLSQNL